MTRKIKIGPVDIRVWVRTPGPDQSGAVQDDYAIGFNLSYQP